MKGADRQNIYAMDRKYIRPGYLKKGDKAIIVSPSGHIEGEFIDKAVNKLKSGGRLEIISFHSLEDRIVKQKFKELATGCICPPDFPICVCGHKATVKIITKHPVEATEAELKINSRSASAKLRVIEKL